MPTATPPTDPDGLAVLHALSRDGLGPEDAYNAVEGIRHMAGHAIAAKLDAHKAEITAKLDAQRAELTTLRWFIGIGFAALGAVIAALRLLG